MRCAVQCLHALEHGFAVAAPGEDSGRKAEERTLIQSPTVDDTQVRRSSICSEANNSKFYSSFTFASTLRNSRRDQICCHVGDLPARWPFRVPGATREGEGKLARTDYILTHPIHHPLDHRRCRRASRHKHRNPARRYITSQICLLLLPFARDNARRFVALRLSPHLHRETPKWLAPALRFIRQNTPSPNRRHCSESVQSIHHHTHHRRARAPMLCATLP